MGKLVFVTGGARSGKSGLAEGMLSGMDDVLYIATAVPFDDEMKERIRLHRERRNPLWKTFEGHTALGREIDFHAHACIGVLLDCVTVMVANIMLERSGEEWEKASQGEVGLVEERINSEVEDIIRAASGFSGLTVVVSNEVGMGIVPATPLSRYFRDIAGRVNQKIASAADEVYLVVSGIPVKIKGGA